MYNKISSAVLTPMNIWLSFFLLQSVFFQVFNHIFDSRFLIDLTNNILNFHVIGNLIIYLSKSKNVFCLIPSYKINLRIFYTFISTPFSPKSIYFPFPCCISCLLQHNYKLLASSRPKINLHKFCGIFIMSKICSLMISTKTGKSPPPFNNSCFATAWIIFLLVLYDNYIQISLYC